MNIRPLVMPKEVSMKHHQKEKKVITLKMKMTMTMTMTMTIKWKN